MAEVQGVQGQRGVATPQPSVSFFHALGHLYDAVIGGTGFVRVWAQDTVAQ